MSDHGSPPRENLIRAVMPGVSFRDSSDDDAAGPVLFGHFARFNEWTEIDSVWEGRFMERFAPGAFRKTIREGRDKLRVLFQHGHDPEIGDKPIAAINDVREDDEGAFYEARLFDGLPSLIMDGLRAGQYGASFRFGALREQWDEKPEASEHNPNGLPERTIKEARVAEFGPVTFPAYEGATAGVRSLTDEFLMSAMRADPDKAREMFDRALSLKDITPASEQDEADKQQDAPSEDDAGPDEAHLADERRETVPEPPKKAARAPIYGNRRKEKPSWLLEPSKSTSRS
jgi:HK97 family phage prohead protease